MNHALRVLIFNVLPFEDMWAMFVMCFYRYSLLPAGGHSQDTCWYRRDEGVAGGAVLGGLRIARPDLLSLEVNRGTTTDFFCLARRVSTASLRERGRKSISLESTHQRRLPTRRRRR